MAQETTAFCRTEKSTVDCFFELRFVERCYDACSRWYLNDSPYWPYYEPDSHGLRKVQGVADDPDRILDRESEVKKAILRALDCIEIESPHSKQPSPDVYSLLYGKNFEGARFLRACVNPECTLRTWDIIDLGKRKRTSVKESKPPEEASCSHFDEDDNIRKDLKAMAGCVDYKYDPFTLTKVCACKKERHLFKIIPIHNKWIYGFSANGKHLHPEWEIHVESEEQGRIYWRFAAGKFSDGSSTAFTGGMPVPKLTGQMWHFFLSPKRLGPKALHLLCENSESGLIFSKPQPDSLPGEPPTEDEPYEDRTLQPWALTAKRRFYKEQIPTRCEYIPLVDPFAWAATANEVDYIPILEAQRIFATNENERSKWLVAGMLRGAIDAIKGYDRYELEKRLHPAPKSEGGVNIAEAWMRHYNSLTAYVAREVDRAFRRVRQAVVRSPGHRIIEVSCQEHLEEPEYLQFGLLHWQHLLAEAPSSPSGREFARWLVQEDALKERIPKANVLRCIGLTQHSIYIRTFGPASPAQIFASLIPVLVVTRIGSGASAPPATISEYFERTAGEKGFWWRDEPGEFAVSTSETVLKVKEEELEKYSEEFRRYFSTIPKPLRDKATSFDHWRGFLRTFKAIGAIWAIAAKLNDFKDQLRSRREFGWEAFDIFRAMFLELPQTGAELMKAAGLIRELSKEDLLEAFNNLKREHYDIFMRGFRDREYRLGTWGALLNENKAERDAIQLQMEKDGVKVLGVLGYITTILDLISETGQTLEADRARQNGVAVGHAIKAAGALVVTIPMAARFLGLLTAAEYEALAGPIGWIGAAATLCGAAWVYIMTPSSLQLFAERCFLGNSYGQGDFEKEAEEPWMVNLTWPELRYDKSTHKEARDRFVRQARALLYWLCNFTIKAPNLEGCWIRPRLIPDGGVFSIEVALYFKERNAPQTYLALCFPAEDPSQSTSRWVGKEPNDSSIQFHGNKRLDHIHVSVNPPIGRPAVEIRYRVNLCRMASGGRLERILPVEGAAEWVEVSSSWTNVEVEALSVLPSREKEAERTWLDILSD